ncbi:copper homeostasis protein CutC [Virgibacillus profundi]|uniref:PF03932 family protein CutC n=1 Tax=Virgibacillus profundi TaxID=2024555 RepID=A0A2A2I8G1_9BACI|nr:copper homeostasis protein CutC [Virgibacillus profundi]PAV27606.1 copper homeostasis protein CutC [Virgibacillus profundi]PXY51784.1 copper homeostasis protein CutC [Virgibacillus profundi]
MIIEVIVQNKEEAMEAERLGADRLELVSAIEEGGLTPSFGTIKQVLGSVSIPVQIMIRPHSYHFEYTESDLDTIYDDIKKVLDLGGTGIVFGALNKDKMINQEVLRDIINISAKLDITFHRAFDEVPSQEKAYHTLLEFKQNVRRILTSGGEADCEAGKYNLKKLVKLSKKYEGPQILPGAGLSGNNIKMIHQTVGADQYHFGKAVRKENSFANGFDEQEFGEIRKFKLM